MRFDLSTLKTTKTAEKITRFTLAKSNEYFFFNSIIFPNYYSSLTDEMVSNLVPTEVNEIINRKVADPLHRVLYKKNYLVAGTNKELYKRIMLQSLEAPFIYTIGAYNISLPEQPLQTTVDGRPSYQLAVEVSCNTNKRMHMSYSGVSFIIDKYTLMVYREELKQYEIIYSFMIRNEFKEAAKIKLLLGEEIPNEWLAVFLNIDILKEVSGTFLKYVKTVLTPSLEANGIPLVEISKEVANSYIHSIKLPVFATITARKEFLFEYGKKMIENNKAGLTEEEKKKIEEDRLLQEARAEAELIKQNEARIRAEEAQMLRDLQTVPVGESMSDADVRAMHKLMRDMEGLI